jgi:hypothetical protein
MTGADGRAGHALARPEFGLNHVLAYGQSLATGWEGWPALSTTQPFDSLMLGASVRPAEEQAPHWRPMVGPVAGEGLLRPLVATVQAVPGGALLDPAQVAALPRGNVAMGETVLEGAINTWRGRMERRSDRVLLASACGVGGRSLEQLAKGARPELFNRLRECVAAGRQAAAAAGRSYGVVALLFLQGEHNAVGVSGAVAAKADYKALLRRFNADFLEDVVHGVAGQSTAPAVFTYQTGGGYASDTLDVAMAQLEVATEAPGVFMAGPVYPVSDKGGHLDANGYRWLGAQFGKVMHRVLSLGLPWMPLHPLRAVLHDRTVVARFHVPVPPLVFDRVLAARRWVEFADRGFAVVDADGPVPVEMVEIDGPYRVAITLARRPGAGAVLRYGDRTGHQGRGCLHDSDTAVADDCYLYDAATGHDPAADIPGLVGQRYRLANWCVAFRIVIQGV